MQHVPILLLLLGCLCAGGEETARFISASSFSGTSILSSEMLDREQVSNRLRSVVIQVARSRIPHEMEGVHRRQNALPKGDKGLIAGFSEALSGEVERLQAAGAIGLTVRFRQRDSWSDSIFGFSRAAILDNKADVRWVDAVLPGDAFEDALRLLSDLGFQRREFLSARPGFSHTVCYSFQGWGDKEKRQSPYVLVVMPLGYRNEGVWVIAGAVSFLVDDPWSPLLASSPPPSPK